MTQTASQVPAAAQPETAEAGHEPAAGEHGDETALELGLMGVSSAVALAGIGLAFFVDGLDLTVRTARHAEEVAELPVLATLSDRRRRSLR